MQQGPIWWELPRASSALGSAVRRRFAREIHRGAWHLLDVVMVLSEY